MTCVAYAALLKTLCIVSAGLSFPTGVAVDRLGDVYIADAGNNTIFEWTPADSNLVTLVASGLDFPRGVAVDVAGNVYIADTDNQAIKEWFSGTSNVITLVSNVDAQSLSVDGSGNVYFDEPPAERIAANNSVSYLDTLSSAGGVAVDGIGNVYACDDEDGTVIAQPFALVDAGDRLESLAAGKDTWQALLPATNELLDGIVATTLQPWLTINGLANGSLDVSFAAATSDRSGYIFLLGESIPITQGGPTYSLGTTTLLEGPSSGSDSVTLGITPQTATWTATANADWLHLNQENQSGAGTTNVIFTYNANLGPTRSGTLTIAGQTLTVTQAGSRYVPAGAATTLVSTGLQYPVSLAVDSLGNVYIADWFTTLDEWNPTNNTMNPVVPAGQIRPRGLAVDTAGNVYITDDFNNVVEEWMPSIQSMITLIADDLSYPSGVAVDNVGNVYIADSGHNAIKEWLVPGNFVNTLVNVGGFNNNVIVDCGGDVYFAATDFSIEEWMPANNLLDTPIYFANGFCQIAVDSSGDIYFPYISDIPTNTGWINKWKASDNTLTRLNFTGLSTPFGLAVDSARNVYVADAFYTNVLELPCAFVDPTPKLEGLAAGSDSLPVVLPATENLLPPFAPTSDQSWLTISGITNGVVSFSFTANTGPARTADITLLGQSIPITQGTIGTPPTLTGVQMLGGDVLQFDFTDIETASLTVLSSTTLALPLSQWTVVGTASNTAPGRFQFTTPTTNEAQAFYRVRSP